MPSDKVALLRRDPSGTMTAFADMMRKQIVMPAHLMDDLEHKGRTGRSLFKDFSSVAQMTGTYTGHVCTLAGDFAGHVPLCADLSVPRQVYFSGKAALKSYFVFFSGKAASLKFTPRCVTVVLNSELLLNRSRTCKWSGWV